MRPRDRMMLPLAIFVGTIMLALVANFLVRNDDRSFQALLVGGGLLSPVLAYVFAKGLLRNGGQE